MSTAFLTLDRGWRFTYLNGAAERILGRTRAELVGRVIWDEFPEAVGTESDTNYRAAMDSNRAASFQQYFPPLETWFDVRATPTGDGISVYFHDITDRVRAEQDGDAATGRLQILSAASARLAGTLEIDELLEILTDVILNGFGDGVVLALAESIRREDGTGEGFTIAHVVPSARDASVVGHLSLTGTRVDASALSGARELRAAELAEPLGDRPALTLPLVSRGRTLGAIVVLDPVTSELDLLVELAARAGAALDNAVLYAAERRLALTLQRSLLPVDLPDLPGIELAARYLPGTGGRDVGGDFYLAHSLADGRLLVVIGDVMGHGAQAAARMGQLRAVVAAYAYDGDPPDRVLAHLSIRASALLDLPMATVLAGVYDPESRRLTFALAGHLPPLIVPVDGPPGVRRRPARAAVGRRGHGLRAPRRRAPAGRRGRALHRRADRGPHAADRRRAGAVARRARGHPAGAGRDLRPRARGARALRRGGRRHRPAGPAALSRPRGRLPPRARLTMRLPRRTVYSTWPSRWWSERYSRWRSGPGIGTGQAQRAGCFAAQLDAPARRGRADLPLAATRAGDGARERRGEGHHSLRRPERDRGRGDAVDAPTGEGHALGLAPPPVVGEGGAPVLLRVDVGAVERAGAEGAGDTRAEQPRRPVLAEPGDRLRGAERAERAPRPDVAVLEVSV